MYITINKKCNHSLNVVHVLKSCIAPFAIEKSAHALRFPPSFVSKKLVPNDPIKEAYTFTESTRKVHQCQLRLEVSEIYVKFINIKIKTYIT